MTQNIPQTLEETYEITAADTDFTKKLNTRSLTNMFIQSAWHHAEALGFGTNFLNKNKTVWMLSRFQMRLETTPFWNEKILMTTWPKGIHRVFYQRDFEAFTMNKRKIAAGTSEWMIIDLKTKRPILFHADSHIFNPEYIRHAIDSEVPVLETPESGYDNFTRKVKYSDIDLNEHLTTIRYIDWMFDTFNLEFLNAYACKEIIINFIREIPYNTEVIILRYQLNHDNKYVFEFTDFEINKPFFRGQLGF